MKRIILIVALIASCSKNSRKECPADANGNKVCDGATVEQTAPLAETPVSEVPMDTINPKKPGNQDNQTTAEPGTYDDCTVNGQKIAHEASITRVRYQTANVAFNSICSSETQTATCNDGVLSSFSGSYTNESCSVASASDCVLNGQAIANGASTVKTTYASASVAWNATCTALSTTYTCNNGSLALSGDTPTANLACSPATPLACGGTAHQADETRTMYQAASVAVGNSCVSQSQTRTCTDGAFGAWSGSYANTACNINCGDFNGSALVHGGSANKTYYNASVAQNCSAISNTQTATCSQGVTTLNPASYSGSDSCVNDTTPPTASSIAISGGAASTTTTNVVLTLAATGDVSDMYITNTAACGSGGNWETYSATKNNWTLGQTNGTATVYVKFRDAVGNESSCINDTITHASNYTVGGTVSGLLSGRTVVLRNNGGDDLTVSANGSFTFATTIANNAAYAVTVLTQPTDQSCTVTSGTGTVTANVNTVSVACVLSCTGLAGGNWVRVPGESTYGTSDFCVMKYEARNVGGTATSQTSGTPWVSINQTAAQTACSNLGANFQLITNNQWMSLASNIASTASNWSGGSVGSGTINRGHSDGSPGSSCAASADDSFSYVQSDCTPRNSGDWSQKRTHILSTGAVIWDLAGNVHDWTSYVIANNNAKPYVTADGSPQVEWRELSAINNGFTAMTLKELRPINTEKSFWSDSWNSTQGVGQYFAGPNGSGGALLRGAYWSDGTAAGVFSARLFNSPSISLSYLGFRCARVASP